MIEKEGLVTIKGFPNYAVNRKGDVFNIKTGRKLRQQVDEEGYHLVFLYNENGRKQMFIHRIVAMAYLPNENGYPQVNHKDENPGNNCVENLEWCTSKYNANYGTHKEKLRQYMLANNPFRGKKHSEETRAKISAARLGKESKRKRRVTIGGVEYASIAEAMETLHICTRRLYKLLEKEEAR